jgi:hypothetical protein
VLEAQRDHCERVGDGMREQLEAWSPGRSLNLPLIHAGAMKRSKKTSILPVFKLLLLILNYICLFIILKLYIFIIICYINK